MKGRALFFVAPGRVELRDVEVPEPRAGEVLVRSLYSGISSGTEMLAYRGLMPPGLARDESLGALGGTFVFPFRYGYSCVGLVDQPRDSPLHGSLVFAFHPHQDLFTSRESEIIATPDTPPRIATLLPHLETALQISLEVEDDDRGVVVVLGLGAVGALSALLIARRGLDVVGVDLRTWRAEAARRLNVEVVAPEDLEDEVRQRSAARGAAVVVEASGNPNALAQALTLLRHEGTVLVASWYGSEPVSVPLGREFHRRRLTIRSTQVSTIPARLAPQWTIERRRRTAVHMLGELRLQALATHEFPFRDAHLAYRAIDRGEEGLIHAALRYDREA